MNDTPTEATPNYLEIVNDLMTIYRLSPEQIASRLGVSFMSVYRWKNGATTPLPNQRRKLVRMLEVEKARKQRREEKANDPR
jgi:ribosome-binding protein aMBF1 (putative translation factor)